VSERFRCALTSDRRGDDLAGTASTVRAYLLVEWSGAWGVDALRDSRLPEEAKRVLRAARGLGVRVNLVRRHRAPARQDRMRVLAAYADPERPWLEVTELASPAQVAELDLDALGAGRSPGMTPVAEPVFAVCTHGRHDACCAELGRPLAAALSTAQPDATWEVSHIGGDRFAGNLLVLPHGLYYGRVDPQAAIAIAAAHRSGHLDLDHLRGRSSYPMPVQAAEIALRRQLGETRLAAVRPVELERDGDRWRARFQVGAEPWEVVVRTTLDDTDRHRLTCLAERADPIPRHHVLAVRRPGRG
jgi:hypothetical protein